MKTIFKLIPLMLLFCIPDFSYGVGGISNSKVIVPSTDTVPKNRLEVEPFFSFTKIDDAFNSKNYGFGSRFTYGFLDSLEAGFNLNYLQIEDSDIQDSNADFGNIEAGVKYRFIDQSKNFRILILNEARDAWLKYDDLENTPRTVMVCETCYQKQIFKIHCWICKRSMANFGFYLDENREACNYCLSLPEFYKTIVKANVNPRPESYQEFKQGIREIDLELGVEVIGKYMIYNSLQNPNFKKQYFEDFLTATKINQSGYQWDYVQNVMIFVQNCMKQNII